MEPIPEHSEHDLPYWKGRKLDLEELIYYESDVAELHILLVKFARAYVEIQILEICMSIR